MTHTLNSDRSAAVALDVFWQPITPETPRGVRMLLISKASGIAQVSTVLAKESFFTHWAALPRWPAEVES